MSDTEASLSGGRGAVLLITGAGGFIGARVNALATSLGMRVLAHSRRPGPGISWVADLRDRSAVKQLAEAEIGVVIHCAAAVPSRSIAFMEDNAEAARVLTDVLQATSTLRRIVHLSSVSVYRLPPAGPFRITEQSPLVDAADVAGSPYARSKRIVEQQFDGMSARRPELDVIHVRPSSVYGRGMVTATLLPALVSQARKNDPITLRGPSGYIQNFVSVEDVADLSLRLANGSSGRGTSAINAFSDDTLGLHGLADLVRDRLLSRSPVIDQTTAEPFPKLEFDNRNAKLLLPAFRRLHDHLGEVA